MKFVCLVWAYSRSCRDVLQDEALPNTNTPYFVNVDYSTGRVLNYWMDALSASFAAVQVLLRNTVANIIVPCLPNRHFLVVGIICMRVFR